jgi:hypothetical protein
MNVIVYGMYDNSGFYKHGSNGWVYLSLIEGARKSIYAMTKAELADVEKEIKLLVFDRRMPKAAARSLHECYMLAKSRRDCEDRYESMSQRVEKAGEVIPLEIEEKALQLLHDVDNHYKNNCNKVI